MAVEGCNILFGESLKSFGRVCLARNNRKPDFEVCSWSRETRHWQWPLKFSCSFPHACCLSETGWLSWLQAQSDLFASLIRSSTSPSLWIPGSPGRKRGRNSVFTRISVRGDKEGDRVGLWDSQTQCLPQDFTSGPCMRWRASEWAAGSFQKQLKEMNRSQDSFTSQEK